MKISNVLSPRLFFLYFPFVILSIRVYYQWLPSLSSIIILYLDFLISYLSQSSKVKDVKIVVLFSNFSRILNNEPKKTQIQFSNPKIH